MPAASARDAHQGWRSLMHDWMRDPERRGEGLICRVCGITEAEMEAIRSMTGGSICALADEFATDPLDPEPTWER